MHKILKKLFASSLLLGSLPFVTISCKREDDEPNFKNDDPSNNPNNKVNTFKAISVLGQEIAEIYEKSVLPLFKDVKDNYFSYKFIWNELINNLNKFRKKILTLSNEQSIPANEEAIRDFLKKWLPNANSNAGEYEKFGMYLYKYELIYQDVDAVLNDVNIVFNESDFFKFLKVIDDRLNNKDISLSDLQSAIISIWKFLNSHVFNPNKLTKMEDIENQNLEDDKNSHTHSHAIINLIHEMGLWHKKMGDSYKEKDSHNKTNKDKFIDAFESIEDKIVDNTNHIDWKTNWSKIKNTLEEFNNSSPTYDLMKQDFKDRGQKILDDLKKLLLAIAQKEGLKNINLE